MIFNLNNFVIDVDVERTRDFYDKLEEEDYYCSCDNCRNYVLAVEDFPKEVIEFFNKLGINIKKTIEVHKVCSYPDSKYLCYEGFYYACGKLIRDKRIKDYYDEWKPVFINENKPPIFFPVIGDDYFYQIVDNYLVWFDKEVYWTEDKLPLPSFRMEIRFSKIPWKLN